MTIIKFRAILLISLFIIGFYSQDINAQIIPSNIPTNGLLGWWPFNGNTNDESGNGNHLSNFQVELLNESKKGNVAKFNGNGWLYSDTSIFRTLTPITIAFWARTQSNYAMDIISQACDFECGDDIRIQFNAAQCGYTGLSYKSPAFYASAPANTVDNGWHHFILVMGRNNNFSFENFEFYVDGVEINIGPNVCSHNWGAWNYSPNPNHPFKIGKNAHLGANYTGFLDEVGVWGRDLTQQEIEQLYIPLDCPYVLTAGPEYKMSKIDSTISFTANISSNNPQYFWQSNCGQGFQNLSDIGFYSGTNSNDITINDLELSHHSLQLRAISNYAGCTDTSNTVTIFLTDSIVNTLSRPQFNTGSIDSAGDIICIGENPAQILSLNFATGGDSFISYSWRSSTDNYTSEISGAVGASYTPPPGLTATTSYRRYANDGTCNTSPSQSDGEWTVIVRPAFNSGIISSVGDTICYSGNPSVIGSVALASGGSGDISYSWRSSSDNFISDIIGANSPTFLPPPSALTASIIYHRYAADLLCNVTPIKSAGEWELTVNSIPVITCPDNLIYLTSHQMPHTCSVNANWIHPSEINGFCVYDQLSMSINGSSLESVNPGTAANIELPVGIHQLSYELNDGSVNSTVCAFSITVIDDEIPVINCIANKSIRLDGQNSVTLNVEELAIIEEDCTPIQISILPNVLTVQQLGQIIPVKVVAIDMEGNVAECSVQVTLESLPIGWVHQTGSVGNCLSTAEYKATSGIWNTTAINCLNLSPFQEDALMFAHKELCGDGSITVKVDGLNGGPGFAGITMRESNSRGSKKVQLMINGSSNIARREIRMFTGDQALPSDFSSPATRIWLRIVRTGNLFRGYTSHDGQIWWYVMQVMIPMESCINVGMVLNNLQAGVLTSALFSNVFTTGNNGVHQSGMIGGEIATDLEVRLYPNPAITEITIDLGLYSGKMNKLEVFNLQGHTIYIKELGNSDTGFLTLDVSNFTSGLYGIRLISPEMDMISKRFVIVRN
jgi:hypothetical protein